MILGEFIVEKSIWINGYFFWTQCSCCYRWSDPWRGFLCFSDLDIVFYFVVPCFPQRYLPSLIITKLIPDSFNGLPLTDQKVTLIANLSTSCVWELSLEWQEMGVGLGVETNLFCHFMMKSWPSVIFVISSHIFSHLWQLNFDFYKTAHKTKNNYFDIHLKMLIEGQLWISLGARDTVSKIWAWSLPCRACREGKRRANKWAETIRCGGFCSLSIK